MIPSPTYLPSAGGCTKQANPRPACLTSKPSYLCIINLQTSFAFPPARQADTLLLALHNHSYRAHSFLKERQLCKLSGHASHLVAPYLYSCSLTVPLSDPPPLGPSDSAV